MEAAPGSSLMKESRTSLSWGNFILVFFDYPFHPVAEISVPDVKFGIKEKQRAENRHRHYEYYPGKLRRRVYPCVEDIKSHADGNDDSAEEKL